MKERRTQGGADISRRHILATIGGAASAVPLLFASARGQSVASVGAKSASDDEVLIEAPPPPSRFSVQPIRVETSPKWVRVIFGGEVVANSKNVLLVWDRGRTPVYYFPLKDVRKDLLTPSDKHTKSDTKGEASYYTLKVGAKTAQDAVWYYPKPETADPKLGKAPDLREYVSFEWSAMDAWYEEGEEVFVHPHDPYHRIDVLASSRHVKVVLGNQTVAESRRPVLLFETGFVTRYYLPKEDVRFDLLRPSETITRCAYKGEARYYSVEVGGKIYKDIIWYYRFPTTEASKIANNLAFYNEQVDAIFVDGEEVPKVKRTRG